MKNLTTSSANIYPGSYVPLLNEEETLSSVQHFGHLKKEPFAFNVTDDAEAYRIDIAIPGVRPENFLVDADDHGLNVYVQQRRFADHQHFGGLQQTTSICSDCEIALPGPTDPDFILAQYSGGMLHLYVPKVAHAGENHRSRVVVY